MENAVNPQKGRGLLLGILTGWAGVLLIDIFSNVFAKENGEMNLVDFNFGFLLPAYIIIGLPIALTLGLIFGNIIWTFFERKGLTKIRHALFGGGMVGALFGGTNFYLTVGYTNIFHNLADLASTIAIGVLAGFVTHKVGYAKLAVNTKEVEAEI